MKRHRPKWCFGLFLTFLCFSQRFGLELELRELSLSTKSIVIDISYRFGNPFRPPSP